MTWNKPETRKALLGPPTLGKSDPKTDDLHKGPLRQVRDKPEMITRLTPWGLDRELA